MKRLIAVIALVILMLPKAIAEEIRFQDHEGTEIVLNGKPQKVCVLLSSFAQMWILAGGEVGITVYESVERGFSPEGIPLVDSGAGKNVDLEALIFEEPDFVIGSMDIPSHVEAKRILSKIGIPTAVFRVESFQDYLDVISVFCRITGDTDAFYTNATLVQKGVEEVLREAQSRNNGRRPQILFIRSGSGYSSCKAKTADMHFAAQMLEELGAHNIADDVPVILDGLSFEEILLKDPDAIFISIMGNEEKSRAYMESVLQTNQWQLLSAVQQGRVYFLPKELFQYKPNNRWDEAYGMLTEMLYP